MFFKSKENASDGIYVDICLLWLVNHAIFQLITFQFTTGFIKPILTSVNCGLMKRVLLASSSIEFQSERNCC